MFACSSVAPATPIERMAVAVLWQHQYVRVWAGSTVCGCGLWRRAVCLDSGFGMQMGGYDGPFKTKLEAARSVRACLLVFRMGIVVCDKSID